MKMPERYRLLAVGSELATPITVTIGGDDATAVVHYPGWKRARVFDGMPGGWWRCRMCDDPFRQTQTDLRIHIQHHAKPGPVRAIWVDVQAPAVFMGAAHD